MGRSLLVDFGWKAASTACAHAAGANPPKMFAWTCCTDLLESTNASKTIMDSVNVEFATLR
jgi:hypothetical protein